MYDMDACTGSTPATKRPPLCTPVKAGTHCGDSSNHQQKTPLSRIHQLVHGGVQLLASSPASLRTPDPATNVRWTKDNCTPECTGTSNNSTHWTGRSMFRTPLTSSNSHASTRCYNPFETALLESLHQPVAFSPNVFKTSTPGSTSSIAATFQWTIDEIAVLKPVNIETPHRQLIFSGHNSDVEARAQRAIETYFNSNIIVPSPWTDSSKKKTFRLPQTPGSNDSPMIFSSKQPVELSTNKRCLSSPKVNTSTKQTTKQVAVQTVITIPLDVDLERLLGDDFKHTSCSDIATDGKPGVVSGVVTSVGLPTGVQQSSMCGDDDAGTQDVLSNSSLRRKLFFHGDEGTPISPVRSSRCIKKGHDLRPLSPSNDSMLSDQFTSSPIRILHTTPTVRRCSTAPQLLESPAMSPINHYYFTSNRDSSEKELPCSINDGCQRRPSPSLGDITDNNNTVTPTSVSTAVRSQSTKSSEATNCRHMLSVFIEELSSDAEHNMSTQQTDVNTATTDTGYHSNITSQVDTGYHSQSHMSSHTGNVAPQTDIDYHCGVEPVDGVECLTNCVRSEPTPVQHCMSVGHKEYLTRQQQDNVDIDDMSVDVDTFNAHIGAINT